MRDKLIEIISSVQYNNYGSTIGKNFLRGFVERIANHLMDNGAIILVCCEDCLGSEPCEVKGKVWCKKMGRYMKEDGFCSEGEWAGNG